MRWFYERKSHSNAIETTTRCMCQAPKNILVGSSEITFLHYRYKSPHLKAEETEMLCNWSKKTKATT